MEKVRMGVIGVGWWGTVGHLDPLSKDERAEVVAIYSRTEAKVAAKAQTYGVSRYYTDYKAMIDECNLDAVSIATTPNMHFEQARYALQRGVHVLMEKPFVLHAAQAEELQRLAEDNGLLLSVCHPLLYNDLFVEAKKHLLQGALGELLLVNALFSQRVIDLYRGDVDAVWRLPRRDASARPNNSSYSDPSVAGGGEGHTQASHILGIALWLTGLRPESVFAYMNKLDVAVDVVDAMTIRFQGGALGNVCANGMLPASIHSSGIQIQGTNGILILDSATRSGYIRTADDAELRTLPSSGGERGGVSKVTANFVRCVLGEEEQYVPTEVAVNEVRILDAAYRSAAGGMPVQIDSL